jgi:hypothetical protein
MAKPQATERRRVSVKTAPAAKTKAPTTKVVVNTDTHQPEEVPVEEEVSVLIPHHFTLTLDNYHEIKYRPGTHSMPQSHFDHWYTKLMGVKLAAEAVAKTAAA